MIMSDDREYWAEWLWIVMRNAGQDEREKRKGDGCKWNRGKGKNGKVVVAAMSNRNGGGIGDEG